MKRIWLISLPIILVLSLLFDFVFKSSEETNGEMWWVNLHVFYIVLGFIGCVVIVYVAKWLSKHWLGKREDYYD
jgi:hypothetical protein